MDNPVKDKYRQATIVKKLKELVRARNRITFSPGESVYLKPIFRRESFMRLNSDTTTLVLIILQCGIFPADQRSGTTQIRQVAAL